MSVQIIVNADDWGASSEVNAAVLRAHREGVLTSASLMVTGRAVEEAVAMAREHPSLAVGLHLVLAGGRPALPAAEIPHLVGADGRLDGPTRLGLRLCLQRAARRQLAAEIEAQFQRFAETGLSLDHVNAHLHFHLHPVVLSVLLPIAARYGAIGFRVPRDRLGPALRHSPGRAGIQIGWAVAYGVLNRLAWRRLQGYGFVLPRRVIGLFQSGAMEIGYLLEALADLREGPVECYFHPATREQGEPYGPNPGDLRTLLDPRLHEVIVRQGLVLTTYTSLAGEARPCRY